MENKKQSIIILGDYMKTTSHTLSPLPVVKKKHPNDPLRPPARPRYVSQDPRICKGGRRKIDAILISDANGTVHTFTNWIDAAAHFGSTTGGVRRLENQTIQDRLPQKGKFAGCECVVITK